MSRTEDLAICFANLKGSKDKDLLATAEALRRLKREPEFSSNAKLGRAVGVSGEIVREFLSLLTLPVEIQKLLHDRVLGLEHGRRLAQIGRRRPELLQQVTEAMMGMNAIDSRDFVTYLLKHDDLSVDAAKAAILAEKPRKLREFHVLAELSEDDYVKLSRVAQSHGVSVNHLVTRTIRDWLSGQAGYSD